MTFASGAAAGTFDAEGSQELASLDVSGSGDSWSGYYNNEGWGSTYCSGTLNQQGCPVVTGYWTLAADPTADPPGVPAPSSLALILPALVMLAALQCRSGKLGASRARPVFRRDRLTDI